MADLTVLSSVGRVDNFEVGSAKLNTKEYGAALLGSCYYGAAVEYDVNRAWSTLEFTAGVDDGSTMEQARVTISVDDRPALFSEAVHLASRSPTPWTSEGPCGCASRWSRGARTTATRSSRPPCSSADRHTRGARETPSPR
ncbi:hypothetical protein SF23_04885 [Streptomyces sp. MBRL 10]|nr:hypothetical protein SF23_04885 [Streptomyces sp. MBRL 10]